MPRLIYFLAGGSTFFVGLDLIALAVVVRGVSTRKYASICSAVIAVIGATMVAMSGTALAFWLYAIWGAGLAVWLFTQRPKSKRWKTTIDTTLLLILVFAAGNELRFEISPTLPAGTYSRLYVIGDSISAGTSASQNAIWPSIIREKYGVDVVNLARAGSTARQAIGLTRAARMSDGLVLIEIGGNDIIGRTPPIQFANDLEKLITQIESPARRLVMLELPILPFDNAYGLAQRRVAMKHNVKLIPRRFFTDVLAGQGATVDGIHLSAVGQRRMAEMIWGMIGGAMAVKCPTRPS